MIQHSSFLFPFWAILTAVYTSPGVDKDFDEDSWQLKGALRVCAWSRGWARHVPIVSKYYSILYFLVRFLACFWRSLSDAYQYKCRVALWKRWKHPRLRKYYFNRSRSTPLVKLWTTEPIQMGNTNPKSWKSGKTLTSIKLSLFDPVHFRIEHKIEH